MLTTLGLPCDITILFKFTVGTVVFLVNFCILATCAEILSADPSPAPCCISVGLILLTASFIGLAPPNNPFMPFTTSPRLLNGAPFNAMF